LDPNYGSIRIYYEQWDAESDVLIDLKTRPCTFVDFGLDETEEQRANDKQNHRNEN